jgi:hypothetical protein
VTKTLAGAAPSIAAPTSLLSAKRVVNWYPLLQGTRLWAAEFAIV